MSPRPGKRTGVLELAVLGLLHESPMHGYELRKRLSSVLGAFRAFSYGSLYPCLKDARGPRLDRRGRAAAPPVPAAVGQARQDRLPAHRGGQGALPGPLAEAGPDAWEDEQLRRPLRVLRADRRRGPDAHPRGPPRRGSRSVSTALRVVARRAPASASTATPSSSSSTAGERRARGALARTSSSSSERTSQTTRSTDQHSAAPSDRRDRPRPGPGPPDRPRHETRSLDGFGSRSHRRRRQLRRRRWSRASSTTRTPTRPPRSPV